MRFAEVEVSAEDALAAVEGLARVLHVDVIDAVRELLDERGRVEELVSEVARVEVDAELRPSVDRVERLARRDEVVRDLRRVHLEAEANPLLREHVHDRPPALGKVGVAALDLAEIVRREGVEHVPDGRAGEAVDLLDSELRSRTCCVLHPLGGTRSHALGLAVVPDLGRDDGAMALVDRIADALADEVSAEREERAYPESSVALSTSK